MMSIEGIKQVNKEKSEEQIKLDKARAVLKELNFPSDPVDVLSLLEDRPRLEALLHKLKLKIFW